VCPILEVLEIAEETGSILVVDESHSLGTHGPQGAGLVAELGLTERVHFVTASLAKTFAGRAGIIFGPQRVVEYVKYEAFPSIFSSALLPVDIAGLAATLEEIIKADRERKILRRHTRRIREGLLALGYNVAVSQSQIFAIESGSEIATLKLRNVLEREGVFGAPFCAPAAPKNRAMIRFSVTASLTASQIERILSVCKSVRKEVGMYGWRSTMRLRNSMKSVTVGSVRMAA
jgi:CAI-1 autoinducer synthase